VNDIRLIAVEGLPGSGHVDFVKWVGEQPEWFAELEDSAGLLPGIEHGALSHVLQRLVRRFECHQAMIGGDLFRHRVALDFTYHTHALWAQCLLSDSEWSIYQKVAQVITPQPLKLDLVVYFEAPEPRVLTALRQAHKGVDADRWRELFQAYQRYFFAYDETPLLVVRAQAQGWYDGIGPTGALWDKILSYQGGKTYFLGGSGLWDGGRPADD
jgi:hypothetical protein